MFTMEETEENVHDPGTILHVELWRQNGELSVYNPVAGITGMGNTDGEGFGLNIVGGIDSNEFGCHNGIFISSINQGGTADKCGDLDVGDRLLQINDLSLIEVRHVEAVDAFRNAGEMIRLKLEKFGQQLVIGQLSADIVDGPRPFRDSTLTTLQQIKNFMNSWAGAAIIGTVAGMGAMFAVSKLIRARK